MLLWAPRRRQRLSPTRIQRNKEHRACFVVVVPTANDGWVLHCIHVSLYSPSKEAPHSREQDKKFGWKQGRCEWNRRPIGDRQVGEHHTPWTQWDTIQRCWDKICCNIRLWMGSCRCQVMVERHKKSGAIPSRGADPYRKLSQCFMRRAHNIKQWCMDTYNGGI